MAVRSAARNRSGVVARSAAELANVASQEMVKYVAAINNTAPRADRLLKRYTSAAVDLQDAMIRRDQLTTGR